MLTTIDEQDRRILALMGTGQKDAVVARQLGVSTRTLRRRVQRIMRALGADNRFQAGIEVCRRGWL